MTLSIFSLINSGKSNAILSIIVSWSMFLFISNNSRSFFITYCTSEPSLNLKWWAYALLLHPLLEKVSINVFLHVCQLFSCCPFITVEVYQSWQVPSKKSLTNSILFVSLFILNLSQSFSNVSNHCITWNF